MMLADRETSVLPPADGNCCQLSLNLWLLLKRQSRLEGLC